MSNISSTVFAPVQDIASILLIQNNLAILWYVGGCATILVPLEAEVLVWE